MSLIVEDGSGLSTAESYISVAEADAHHSNFGNAAWTGADAVKEVALRKATQYLDAVYGALWVGWDAAAEQKLDWPRGGVADFNGDLLDSNEIPESIKVATAELAVRALSETLLPDVTNPGNIKRTRDKVDVLETEVEYTDGGADQIKRYRQIDLLVREFIDGGPHQVRLRRC